MLVWLRAGELVYAVNDGSGLSDRVAEALRPELEARYEKLKYLL